MQTNQKIDVKDERVIIDLNELKNMDTISLEEEINYNKQEVEFSRTEHRDVRRTRS